MGLAWKNTTARYGWLSMSLHWLMLALIAAAYATMEFKSVYPKGSASRAALADWHHMLGLTVFFMAWLRLAASIAGPDPVIEPALPQWQARVAKAMHWALYALMIAAPLLGWLALDAKGTAVSYLGFDLPVLIAPGKGAEKWLKDIHEAFATTGYFLIGLHAAAALFHHYVMRDNTLKLMLPGR